MNQRLFFAVAIVVVVMVAGTALLFLNQAPGPSKPQGPAAFAVGSASTDNIVQKLQLRLSVNASYAGGQAGNVTVQIKLDEYNFLQQTFNQVPTATSWGLSGLSLGSCGDGIYPFGIALYAGDYIVGNSSEAGNLTSASPLPIFSSTPCPQLTRQVTSYLFSPASNLAVVLPNTANASAMQIGFNLTATTVYRSGVNTSASPINLGPGTYTIAAGDEWGSVVAVHFSLGPSASPASVSPVLQFAAFSTVLAAVPVSAIARTRLRGSSWGTSPCAP